MSPLEDQSRGLLVAVEGISGSGKTTLCRLLTGRPEIRDRWPVTRLGGFEPDAAASPITRFIRELATDTRFVGLPWLAETYLLLAEMLHDEVSRVRPAIRDGHVVLFDGHVDALIAYQSARLRQAGRPENDSRHFERLIGLILDDALFFGPDLVIYVECDSRIAGERIESRDGLAVTPADRALQDLIANEYQRLLSGRDHVLVLESDILAPETLASRAADAILTRFRSQ